MIRFQTILPLLALIFISHAPPPVLAAHQAPASTWKPGTYLGRITIAANVDHILSPLPKGTVREEYHLRVKESTGKMEVVIGQNGNISFGFNIPIRYNYKDWAEVKDDGQGNCRGQKSESTGYGRVRLNSARTLTPAGEKFSAIGDPKFYLGGYSPELSQIGSNCPEESFTKDKLREAMEKGFKKMFSNQLNFEVWSPTDKSMAGICSMPGWDYDPENIFVCTWYVELVPKKK